MTDPAETQADPIRTETVGADTMMAAVTVTAPRPVVFSAFTDPDVLAQWNGETPVTHVSIELTEAAPDRTEVSVTHTANPTVTDRDDHVVGWRDCLTRLVQKYGTTSR